MTQSTSLHKKTSIKADMKHVAVAIPIHKNGKILLHHRDDFDWIPYPNTWGYFGGAVEEGETHEEAMIREIKEEIDFEVSSYQHFVSHKIPECMTHVYLIYIDKDIEELTLSEGQDFGYFDFEDCFKKNLSAPSRLAFDMLRHYKVFRESLSLSLIESKINHNILPAAGAFPINAKGEILLQHRDDKLTILDPNLWSTFGGRSELGETLVEALKRELIEELEFEATHVLPFLTVCKGFQLGQLFLTSIDIPLDELIQHEGQDMDFFSIKESQNLNLAPIPKMAIAMLSSYQNYCSEHGLSII